MLYMDSRPSYPKWLACPDVDIVDSTVFLLNTVLFKLSFFHASSRIRVENCSSASVALAN